MAETRPIEPMLPPEIDTLEPERELPAATTRTNPRLNDAAEAIGGALGSATRQVQNARHRFTVIRGGATPEQLKQAAQEKVDEIRERASAVVKQARIQASAKLQEARITASRMAQNAKDTAAERARVVRLRAARLTDERPLAVLGGLGAAAFLLGIFLRAGRGKRG
jgi:ElaB/YqjD/DUF883 family membrane-anchored ribosome-binding protein